MNTPAKFELSYLSLDFPFFIQINATSVIITLGGYFGKAQGTLELFVHTNLCGLTQMFL